MQFSTITETHITNAPRFSDEILTALRVRFPDREVAYLIGGQHRTFQGYKISGSITKDDQIDINTLMLDEVDKSQNARVRLVNSAKKFMDTWTPAMLRPSNDKICAELERAFTVMLGYVEAHRKDDPVTAESFAKYSDEVAKVHDHFSKSNFAEAAMYLLNSSDVVKGSVNKRTYNAIMKHYKVA